MNWTKKPLLTRAEKAIITRHKNMRKRKLVRAYIWYLAYSFVTILTIAFVASLYATMLSTTIEAVKTPVIAVKAEIRPIGNTIEEIHKTISEATHGENVDVIYNLCNKESGLWVTHEVPCQKYSVNKNKDGSFDYSWLQVNDVHIIGRKKSNGKGTITMECVYDLSCVSKWANEQIKKGNGHIWTAWDNI